ncbi:hypothetical protein FSP39_000956 [Pinctada imbricata]|uniref:Peptidase S1 domain-containing protein n=1 Tax=Pinctada imbricata TaxID=66713 RepID=A0AA89BRY9_PINIB|nr:hypothetical protein FSP39_000956 [Pinctada imbricata]
MHIQSYGMRKGVIKIRVNQEHYQVVSEDIKSTGIDVDIRSVDITEDPIVPFVRQGCRLIRSDEKYGTLGTFANYTVRSGEKKLVALTCAHVCSRGDEVSVVLNDETKRFGTCIDDTCSRQGSEQAHSDLSVVQIEKEMNNNCLRRHLYRKNTTDIKETDNAIVCEDLNEAPPGKVHKVGATTRWTHGEIIGYDNVRRGQDDQFWSYFLVNSYNKSSSFAEGGDSGAVVSTVKFDECNREHALYLGMVSAGPKREKLVRPLPSGSKTSNTSSDMIHERSSTQLVVTKTSTTPGSFAQRVSETHIEAGKARESRTRPEARREGGECTEHADSMQDESNSGLPVYQRPETSTQSEDENSELRGAEGYAKTPTCREEEENLSTYSQPRKTTEHTESRRAEDHSRLAVHHRPETSTQNLAVSSKLMGAEGYTKTPACRDEEDLGTSTRGANGYPVPVVTLPGAERTSGSAEIDDNSVSSISSTDSSDDIYCTTLQPNIQSLHVSVNFNLRY